MKTWDVAVLGLGGVGSAAAYHCARSGMSVLGLDQFTAVHARGSSHGQTRVIRQAYFEHPGYVPLLRRAYENWIELETRAERKLFHRTGIVEIGPSDGVVVPGVLQSANQHHLDVEETEMPEITKRWPMLRGDPAWRAVIETNAGFLSVEESVAAHLELAEREGASCRHEEAVLDWKPTATGIEIKTSARTEFADQMIVAAGAWSQSMLKTLDVQFDVLRKYQYWFPTSENAYTLSAGFPCFFFETIDGYYYGFPKLDSNGIKVARHSGGKRTSHLNSLGDDVDRTDLQKVQTFNRNHLAKLQNDPLMKAGCFYTMTADENFVIDKHPENDRIVIIAGLSGHGFKFTSVLGEIAAEMVQGDNGPDAELFGIGRLLRKS